MSTEQHHTLMSSEFCSKKSRALPMASTAFVTASIPIAMMCVRRDSRT